MKVTCTSNDTASQVLVVLERHGISRGVSWEGPFVGDKTVWILVSATIDVAEEPTIRRDIESIAGASLQE